MSLLRYLPLSVLCPHNDKASGPAMEHITILSHKYFIFIIMHITCFINVLANF